jgi:hypothetical protein
MISPLNAEGTLQIKGQDRVKRELPPLTNGMETPMRRSDCAVAVAAAAAAADAGMALALAHWCCFLTLTASLARLAVV